MASERVQCQIERLLDEAAEATTKDDWALFQSVSHMALAVGGAVELAEFALVADEGLDCTDCFTRANLTGLVHRPDQFGGGMLEASAVGFFV